MRFGSATAITTAMAADVSTLVLTTPTARRLPGHLRDAHQWLAQAGADGAAVSLAAAALWLIALWVGMALLCAVAASAPGRLGSAGQAVARRVMPRAVRVVVLGSIGLAVAGNPGFAQASTNGPSAGFSVGVSAGHTTAGDSAGGGGGGGGESAHADDSTGVAASVQLASLSRAGNVAIGWPRTDASTSATPRIGWPATPATPAAPSHGKPSRHPAPQRRSHSRPGGPVTVAPGDSLWLIAAHRLGPTATQAEIAAAWPEWYATNHVVIGPDPNHIEPRQLLSTPPDSVPDQKGASR